MIYLYNCSAAADVIIVVLRLSGHLLKIQVMNLWNDRQVISHVQSVTYWKLRELLLLIIHTIDNRRCKDW